jgi:tetratricopeptide (TPR) repeat protein
MRIKTGNSRARERLAHRSWRSHGDDNQIGGIRRAKRGGAMRVARAVLAISCAIIATRDARAAGTDQARIEGLQLYQAKHFQEAVICFDQVLARHPRDYEVLLKRGASYLKLEKPERALADFDRVNQHSLWASRVLGANSIYDPNSTWLPLPIPDTNFAESWGNRGVALLMLERNEEALESFKTAVQLWERPQNRRQIAGRAAAYQGLGQAYHRLGDDQTALKVYEAAVTINPADANGFSGRGDVLESMRMPDRAVSDYSEAIRLDAEHSRAYCGRGIAYFALGRDELALADFDRSIALDSNLAKAYSFRGAVHARQGRNEQALADYDTLIRLLPSRAGAYKDRGGLLVRMRQFDRAIEDLDEAIRLDPKRASAYQNRGAAFNGLGRYQQAVDDLSKAIEIDPGNAGAYTNRGLALFALGRYDQSVGDLNTAVQLAPRTAIPYFNRAEVRSRLGQRDRALEDYNEAVRLDPRLAPAYAASARLRDENGQRDGAIRDYDMALLLDPKEVRLYYDRGNVRREAGDWRGALDDYDRAVALDPKRSDAYFARGWARFAAGIPGADHDARVYISLQGWRDSVSPYMAILAVLGSRQANHQAEGDRVLSEALANLSPRAWPVPVLRYLQGSVSESSLLQSAVSKRQQTEARAFIGLMKFKAGDLPGAREHLRWSAENGSPGSIAGDVARSALARIDQPGS